MELIDRRTYKLRINILASFFIKGLSAAIVFLMVPLTLKMLGAYNNGVWLTISSILVWIDLLDIGLGNGMRNAVAKYIALENIDKVREVVSSTLFMLICVIGAAFLILSPIVWFGDMNYVLGIDFSKVPELNGILTMSLAFICLALVLKLVGYFYLGLQLPAINNLILCLGQTLALIGTFVAYLLGSHSLSLVVFINVASPFVVWFISYPVTFCWRYRMYCPTWKMVNVSVAKNLCYVGVQFFILQICSLILFASANIIISKLISPVEVTTYQVAYRYFSIIMVLFTIVCMPFWNATTDAYSRGNLKWIREASKKMNIMMIAIFGLVLIMLIISRYIYHIWIGEQIHVPFGLSLAMALYQFVLVLSMRYSYFLNGIGVLKIQLVFTLFAAIVFLPFACLVCYYSHSVTSLVIVMCLVNIPGLIANIWKFNQIIFKYDK